MRIFACLILALVVGAAPAMAWQEYAYPDQGLAVQFPVKPTVTVGEFDSMLIKGLKATVISAEDDNVIYRMTVVDLAGHTDMATNLLDEAAYFLMRKGNVIFNDFPRLYMDLQSIYGVTVVVDRNDDSRVRSSLYYDRGRLYIAEAIVLPARGDKDMTTPSRFDQTMRFPPDGRFD